MSEARLTVGVLALQGDFAAHETALREVASASGACVDVRQVRRGAQLEGLDGLVMPGGESTTMLKLLGLQGLDTAIPDFAAAGGAIFGTCAGCILLARRVSHPEQRSLELLDIAVERNAYGRQADSFVGRAEVGAAHVEALGDGLEAVFIRAPRIESVGADVEVLATHAGDPVLVRAGRVMAATFHPELARSRVVHRYFVEEVIAAPVAEPVAHVAS